MSSKLPVPVFYRRSITQISEQNVKTPSPSSSRIGRRGSMEGKKDVKNSKYSKVQPRVVTHWTNDEMQRHGLKNFFERKSGTLSANSSTATSPDTPKTSTSKTSRQSLPMACDPISVAIAQLKQNTRYFSFSESTTSSVSSVVNYADAEENH